MPPNGCSRYKAPWGFGSSFLHGDVIHFDKEGLAVKGTLQPMASPLFLVLQHRIRFLSATVIDIATSQL